MDSKLVLDIGTLMKTMPPGQKRSGFMVHGKVLVAFGKICLRFRWDSIWNSGRTPFKINNSGPAGENQSYFPKPNFEP